MSKQTKRGLLAGSVLVIALIVLVVAAQFRTAVTQDSPNKEPTTPRLFAASYAEGHELSGFSGRPMLLIFGDSSTPDWNSFLVECEKNSDLVTQLTTTFQGVFVDAPNDPDTVAAYGNPEVGTALLKDLRGPIRGMLKGDYNCIAISAMLEAAMPYISVEKSPAYFRLQAGTELLDELAGKADELQSLGATTEATTLKEEAAKLLNIFEHFEPNSKALREAKQRAEELRIPVKQG